MVRNAVEATKDGGTVRIETKRDGDAVVVRIVDTGIGMDARQRERAFEDFFTTKDTGSGLGLSFARRVLVAHGGEVRLESERGAGTTIELRLRAGHLAAQQIDDHCQLLRVGHRQELTIDLADRCCEQEQRARGMPLERKATLRGTGIT